MNSGMAALKPYFTAEKESPVPAVRNIQTYIRTNDIESIGDTYHLTIFEMMGSWTFGTLSKEEAIADSLVLVQGVFKLQDKRLCTTYFGGDATYPNLSADLESHEIWMKQG